jgi:outer membrane protein assembly factor BamB
MRYAPASKPIGIGLRGLRASPRAPRVVLAALLFCAAALASGDDWPTFRGDSRRSGAMEGAAIPGALEKQWVFRGADFASPSVDSSPAIVDGRVYVGLAEKSVFSARGRVLCLDAASGALKWEHRTRYPVFSSPSVSGGRVFVGEGYHQDGDCHLYCLDAASGKELWKFQAKSHVESSPHADKERVYFGAGGDGLHCLEAETGKPVWHFDGEHIDTSPLVASGLVFAGSGYGKFSALCLGAKDGKLRWQTPLELAAWGSPVLIGNRLYFGLGNGNFLASADAPKGFVICLAAATGKEIWRQALPDAVLTAIAAGTKAVIAGCRDGNLYAFDPESGTPRWKASAGGAVVASPLVSEREAAAISAAGRLIVVNVETGEERARVEVSRFLGDEVTVFSSPALASGRVVLGTSRGAVLSLGEAK